MFYVMWNVFYITFADIRTSPDATPHGIPDARIRREPPVHQRERIQVRALHEPPGRAGRALTASRFAHPTAVCLGGIDGSGGKSPMSVSPGPKLHIKRTNSCLGRLFLACSQNGPDRLPRRKTLSFSSSALA